MRGVESEAAGVGDTGLLEHPHRVGGLVAEPVGRAHLDVHGHVRLGRERVGGVRQQVCGDRRAVRHAPQERAVRLEDDGRLLVAQRVGDGVDVPLVRRALGPAGQAVQASFSQGTIRNSVSWTKTSGSPPEALSTYSRTLEAMSESEIQAPKNFALGVSAIVASACFRAPVAWTYGSQAGSAEPS